MGNEQLKRLANNNDFPFTDNSVIALLVLHQKFTEEAPVASAFLQWNFVVHMPTTAEDIRGGGVSHKY